VQITVDGSRFTVVRRSERARFDSAIYMIHEEGPISDNYIELNFALLNKIHKGKPRYLITIREL